MGIIDLTHFIAEEMPVFPGTEKPRITDATTIEKNGFAEKLLTFFSHTGTHMDAPGHILAGAKTLDRFDVSRFIGRGVVIDVRNVGPLIETALLERNLDRIKGADFILFQTGWDEKWGRESYFQGFPVLSADAASFLARHDLKGIGVDCISVDPVESTGLGIHRILLNREMVIIENLCGLDRLPDGPFVFSAFPLKLADADGSPVRAVGYPGDLLIGGCGDVVVR